MGMAAVSLQALHFFDENTDLPPIVKQNTRPVIRPRVNSEYLGLVLVLRGST